MNRRISTLSIAAMLAGAVLLSALPASAQYTNNFEASNNPGSGTGGVYSISAQSTHPTYVKESTGSASVDHQLVFLNEVASGNSFGYTANTNYTALVSTDPTQALNGTGTFVNGLGYVPTTNTYQSTVRANGGTQALMVSWQQNGVTGGGAGTTSVYRLTTVGSGALSRPTVDLGGTVSFMMYFDTGAGTGTGTTPNTTPLTGQTIQVELGVNAYSSSTTLGANGNGTGTVYSEYIVGSTSPAVSGTGGTTGTGSNSLVTGGKSVTSGSWQKVTFDLKNDSQTFFAGTAAPNGLNTNPYGFIYDMDFTASGATNQVYNVYIDDLVITPAATPEPSQWAAMGLGAAGLLGLAVRARRRSAGPMAA